MSERMRYLGKPAQDALCRVLERWVWVVTAVVWLLVVLMRRPELKVELPEGWDTSFLTAVNAGLNSVVAILLVLALVAVKRGRIVLHQRFMMSAVGCSILFLLCYVVYHFTNEATSYGGEGVLKMVYYGVLITHIGLAALSFPYILLTLVYAITNQFGRHRRMARWVYFVWLYVAVTGPVVYLMLRPYY